LVSFTSAEWAVPQVRLRCMSQAIVIFALVECALSAVC
jgi:hypothetical protein